MDALLKNFKSNWASIFRYLIIWFIISIIVYIPLIIFYEDVILFRDSKRLFELNQNTYFTFLFFTQLSGLVSVCLTTYFVVKKIERSDLSSLKLKFNLNELIIGFISGTLLMIAFVGIALSSNILRLVFYDLSLNLIFGFSVFLLVALAEEIVIRGYVLSNLRNKLNDLSAVIASSFLFSGLHIFNDNFTWIGFSTIFLSGILMGIFCIKMKTISGAIGLHWAWNFIQGPVAGFNVSGHFTKGVFEVIPVSSDLFTGGNFGAEGSLILIPITLVAIYLAWKLL